MYRVGVLHPGTSQTSSTEGFRQALRELGYVEGHTLAIEWRWAAGNPERYPDLATDLVRSSVDVIVASHGETAMAAKRATQTIPIVVAASVDAVTEGLVTSLARPGGNVTGLSSMIPELTPKRFELLKGIVPGLSPPLRVLRCHSVVKNIVEDCRGTARGEQGPSPTRFGE